MIFSSSDGGWIDSSLILPQIPSWENYIIEIVCDKSPDQNIKIGGLNPNFYVNNHYYSVVPGPTGYKEVYKEEIFNGVIETLYVRTGSPAPNKLQFARVISQSQAQAPINYECVVKIL